MAKRVGKTKQRKEKKNMEIDQNSPARKELFREVRAAGGGGTDREGNSGLPGFTGQWGEEEEERL